MTSTQFHPNAFTAVEQPLQVKAGERAAKAGIAAASPASSLAKAAAYCALAGDPPEPCLQCGCRLLAFIACIPKILASAKKLLSDASEPDQPKTVAPVPATRGKAGVLRAGRHL
jgi:hypothetical protein